MFKNEKLVRGVTTRINKAANNTLSALSAGRAALEPQVTDRLLGAIEQELDGRTIGGVLWVAKTLTDRVRNSEEKEFGADFMGVLTIELDDFNVKKGFFAQAKLIEPSQPFPAAESKRLKSQCEKMLKLSPASYVFIYSQQSGVLIVPAVEILAGRDCNPHEMTSKSIAEFFRDHLECFIGDHRIQGATKADLLALSNEFEVRAALLIAAKISQTPAKG